MAARPRPPIPDLTGSDLTEPAAAGASPLSDEALARHALRGLLADPGTPAAARAQAARTLLELIGALGRFASSPRDPLTPLTELTRAELEAELGVELAP